jgi:UDP-N-acetylglucosamine 4,6-dehydratase/5-epimerase
MRRTLPEGGPTGIRYMLGDVRNYDRLMQAMTGIDTVIHCAAMKMIDSCEYDAWEAASTNTIGTQTVARACIDAGVSRALLVSTDKAADPVSTYGRSKALAEDLWIHGNTYGECQFVAVRYGNVIASAKSVFHHWAQLAAEGKPIPVTHMDATRFYWTLTEAARFCIRHATEPVQRGVTYIPKMRSWSMKHIAESYGTGIEEIGWRCPEKVHETLWSDWECEHVREQPGRYALYPMLHPWGHQTTYGAPMAEPVTSADMLTTNSLPGATV